MRASRPLAVLLPLLCATLASGGTFPVIVVNVLLQPHTLSTALFPANGGHGRPSRCVLRDSASPLPAAAPSLLCCAAFAPGYPRYRPGAITESTVVVQIVVRVLPSAPQHGCVPAAVCEACRRRRPRRC